MAEDNDLKEAMAQVKKKTTKGKKSAPKKAAKPIEAQVVEQNIQAAVSVAVGEAEAVTTPAPTKDHEEIFALVREAIHGKANMMPQMTDTAQGIELRKTNGAVTYINLNQPTKLIVDAARRFAW